MAGFFAFLQKNPFLLLFLTVGLAVWIGRVNIKGYGLGMVAGAIVGGAALSVWACFSDLNNPFLLLFLTVGLAVWIGRVNIKGYGLGMVAGAIVVGAALSVWASS